MRAATSAVMSLDPTPVGITSTTSAPMSRSWAASVRQAHRRSADVMPPGSGVPVLGREGGIEHVDVDGQEARVVADRVDHLVHDVRDPAVADLVHEQ